MDYNNIKYKNNFINQVICRVDFIDYLPKELIESARLQKEIKKLFPRKEKDRLIKFNKLSLSILSEPENPKMINDQLAGIELTSTTKDGKNKLILSNKYLIAEFNNYETFENLFDSINGIIEIIFYNGNFTTERIGLRYINFYDNDNCKPRKKFFNKLISSAIDEIMPKQEENLKTIRSMHLAEYVFDELFVNFRFGLYNKAYPNPIQNNDFVLDYDSFTSEGYTNSNEILRAIEKSHKVIQILFEESITDDLRKIMGVNIYEWLYIKYRI